MRLAEKAELDSFFARKIVLVLVAAHLAIGAAIDHRHPLRAQPLGNGRAIDRRVAGADHDHVAPNVQLLRSGLAALNELQAIDDRFFAGNAQSGRAAQAHTQHHRIEFLLQIGQRQVFTEFHAGADLHAHGLQSCASLRSQLRSARAAQ